ncbi:MAG: protein kinase domain-containing protein [Microcoleaceae cyanobacterium]
MSYCLNPNCPNPSDPSNVGRQACSQCGSELLLKGRYRILRQLGGGGFGKTFEIADEKLKTYRVLKVLLKEHPKAVALFKQEAKVLSELNHPGVPKVDGDGYFTFKPKGSKEPIHCLVMEKIEGANLQDWMKSRKKEPIDQDLALQWLIQLTEILDKVHSLHYFHRDIKPQNIMRKPDGQLVLIDFGTAREVSGTYLAKVEQGQNVTGIVSPGYTPPEQTNGKAVPQSDFFALGRTFVYLLTGKPPTAYPENPRTGKLLWRKGALPSISKQVADIIDYLMAPFPGNRPQNPQIVLQCLREIDLSRSEPLSPTTEPQDTKPKRPKQREVIQARKATLSSRSRQSFQFPLKTVLTLGTLMVLGGLVYTQVDGYLRYGLIPADPILIVKSLPGSFWLEGHKQALGKVYAVAINPNNRVLVSGSAFGAIRGWDLQSGQLLYKPPKPGAPPAIAAHSEWVRALAISPDGKTLASGSDDKTIRLWDLQQGVRQRTIEGHTKAVNAVAFSPNGQLLASGSSDDTIRIENLVSGTRQLTIRTESRGVYGIAFSPDGQTIASAGQDGTIKLWSLARGTRTLTLGKDSTTRHKGVVNAIAYTSDGQVIASGSEDGTVRLWNAENGELIEIVLNENKPVRSLAVSQDGKILAVGSNQIHLWTLTSTPQRLRTAEELANFWGHAEPVTALAISSDSKTLVSGSEDKTIKIWQVPDKSQKN